MMKRLRHQDGHALEFAHEIPIKMAVPCCLTAAADVVFAIVIQFVLVKKKKRENRALHCGIDGGSPSSFSFFTNANIVDEEALTS
ncbi:hypothetical protein OUZ56_015157 [Daphnia magna]|uniref:Uncharacterized protein n=1 Tax=Daphnia magna TaxID=35525 RepID=A0ABR0ALZ2_9CRUS|nr:hypothetical protein OUZ56_015157 [Daphnia magna]